MKGAEGPDGKWKQPWIWLEQYDSEASCALLARKTFSLTSVPTQAELRLSANQIYRLYVNGVCVGRGPDRADPRFPYCDAYDIASHLQIGANVLLVLVYHCRTEMRTWALYDGVGGLTLELRVGTLDLGSDESWKMVQAEAWTPTTRRASKFRGPVFSVDLGRLDQLNAALEPNYDDSAWFAPQIRKDMPLNVLPAEIPRLVSVERLPVHSGSIRSQMSDIEWADPRRGTGVFPDKMTVHPAENGCWLIYDFGRTMGGFPVVEFDTAGCGKVDLHASESLSFLLEDQLMLSDMGIQRYECLDWRGARYLALHFHHLTGPVVVKHVSFNEMVYPFEDRGDFFCSDPIFGKIWRVCRETARINVKDHPVDCCGREQALWLADLTVHCRALSACFGDVRPMEKAVKQVLRVMRDDGSVPIPGPSALGYDASEAVLPWGGQALHLSLILQRIYWYSGQLNSASEALSGLEKLYNLFKRYENTCGLLNTLAEGMPVLGIFCGWNPMQKEGISAALNFEYVISLEAAAELAEACGRTDLADSWKKTARRTRDAAVAAFWDSERCVFTDGEQKDGTQSAAVSVTVNALAALADALDISRRGAWADFLRRNAGVLPPVSPLDASLLLHAFAALDLDLHFRDLLDVYFGSIVRAGQPTLPEFWSQGVNGAGYWGDLSRCHAYGAGPAYLLPEYVLGARPLSPGWREMAVEPRHLGLEHAAGRIPTSQGDVSIQWQREMLSWTLQIEIPQGVTVEVSLPKLGWGNQRLWHNGTLVQQAKGWPDFGAHIHRNTNELRVVKLCVKLETPGRHYVNTEAF